MVYKDVSQDTVSIKNIVTGHIEYETPVMTSDEVTANLTTTTGFTDSKRALTYDTPNSDKE